MRSIFKRANLVLTGKDSDAGKDRRQKEKGVAKDAMVRQHHQLNGRELERTPGDSGRLRSLACCGARGQEELAPAEWLNNCALVLKGGGHLWFSAGGSELGRARLLRLEGSG